MSKVNITFGTAGWRGIISDDFTFANVRVVSQAIADYLKKEYKSGIPAVIVGYDPRFLSENFAAASAEVLAANGIKVHYSDTDVPTPTISYYIIKNGLAGGINITASHNPPEYSGIKFSPSWGGPALPEVTRQIETGSMKIMDDPALVKTMKFREARDQGLITVVDISEVYIERIRQIIDTDIISRNISIAYDAMYGAARKYLPRILPEARLKVINDTRDVLFGGHRPEPAGEYLEVLRRTVLDGKYSVGIATDGDADRFGILDSDGTFITPNQLMGLALYHLYKKGYKGVAVRSVMTSSFMDKVAEDLGVEVIETPVGFKYIGDIFSKQDIIVGGEESGGLTIGGHLPEKDGILACLLACELVAKEGKSLSEILGMLYKRVGDFFTVRKNYKLTQEDMDSLRLNLKGSVPGEFGGYKVRGVNTIDGYKFLIDKENTWLGLRFSGTEPIVRLYAESSTVKDLDALTGAAEGIFKLKVTQ
ncbi:MAG: phosphoglucomutase/phosphomannomutase family protein [Elusimicrobia bacterium]|nr:phosphoglucomutase/phosphomannomutase family protein [Elusimicrobiota bacterium]